MADSLSVFVNIWEVEHHFKCPVIGAMLSVEKHYSILKKCGYDVAHLKSYECHRIIMEKLNGPNNVSIKVNNYIRNQARKYMGAIAGKPEPEIREMWKAHLENGNVGPLLYAIIAHPDTSAELLCDVSGEVHMQAHANMTGIFQVRRKLQQAQLQLTNEQKKGRDKTGQLKTLVKIRRDQDQTITRLENQNRTQAQEIKELSARLPHSLGVDPLAQARADILALEDQVTELREEQRRLEREKRGLEMALFETQSQNKLLGQELQELVETVSARATSPRRKSPSAPAPMKMDVHAASVPKTIAPAPASAPSASS